MPKKCATFISQYLIPSLNTQRFGDRLKWIDRKNSIFQLDWSHKGGPLWTTKEAEVFVEWDKIKGHYQPQDKQYYSKSKQRFRAMLYKLTIVGEIKKVKSDDKYKKVYSIGEKKPRKRKNGPKNSNLENDFYSNGTCKNEISGDMYSDKKRREEVSNDSFGIDAITADHTYSSLLHPHSDHEDQVSTCELALLSENPEKVLLERNCPFDSYENILDGRFSELIDKNILNDISIYDLPPLTKNICDDVLPVEYLEFNQSYSFTDSSSLTYDSSSDELHHPN